eukprot:14134184-Alexandrium_andersonii.AAC.1
MGTDCPPAAGWAGPQVYAGHPPAGAEGVGAPALDERRQSELAPAPEYSDLRRALWRHAFHPRLPPAPAGRPRTAACPSAR